MTTQGRRRRPDLPEGTPERDPSGRTSRAGAGAGAGAPRRAPDRDRRERERGRPKLEPLDVNEAKVIWIGIAVWAAAFLLLLPFRTTLMNEGHGWWLYACLAGAGLGMVGLPLVNRRKSVMEKETEHGRARGARGR